MWRSILIFINFLCSYEAKRILFSLLRCLHEAIISVFSEVLCQILFTIEITDLVGPVALVFLWNIPKTPITSSLNLTFRKKKKKKAAIDILQTLNLILKYIRIHIFENQHLSGLDFKFKLFLEDSLFILNWNLQKMAITQY